MEEYSVPWIIKYYFYIRIQGSITQGRIQSKISEGVQNFQIVCGSRKRSIIARRRWKNFKIWYVYVGKGAS